ncbi:MAG: hypothetical protein ABH851_05855 [Methanobacteriota archaeon]
MRRPGQQKLFPEDEVDSPSKISGKMGDSPETILIKIISGPSEKTREEIIEAAVKAKIDERLVESILEKLRAEGLIYSPSHGVYKEV